MILSSIAVISNLRPSSFHTSLGPDSSTGLPTVSPTVPFRPRVQRVWHVTLNLYLDFSSVVIMTRDAEHFIFNALRWKGVSTPNTKIESPTS